jgi:acyl-CoA reductase-like NAD-dependent aldehyde dehydrogenase
LQEIAMTPWKTCTDRHFRRGLSVGLARLCRRRRHASMGAGRRRTRLDDGDGIVEPLANFPISQAARKVGAALAAGCSLVIKPPEETPSSPSEFVRALADAGLPKGVINLVYGSPAEISGYLISHPAIRKVSFTGSTPVGKQLASMAGLHMTLLIDWDSFA